MGKDAYKDAINACLLAFLIHPNKEEALKDLKASLTALAVFYRIEMASEGTSKSMI